jgi:hypothetical protein
MEGAQFNFRFVCSFVTVVDVVEYSKLYFRRGKDLWSYTSTHPNFFVVCCLINEDRG